VDKKENEETVKQGIDPEDFYKHLITHKFNKRQVFPSYSQNTFKNQDVVLEASNALQVKETPNT